MSIHYVVSNDNSRKLNTWNKKVKMLKINVFV